MKRLIKFIERNISGKKVLLLFILTNVVYVFMLMVTIPKTMAFSGGMDLLDMMPFGYDLNYVNTLFNALGDFGRETYMTKQIPVDMVYPLLFGVTYCLLLGYFLKKIDRLKTPYSYLCLLPIVAGVFDYLENFGILVMLNDFPDLTVSSVSLINVFTIIKSISTSLFFISLLVVLISLLLRYLNKKKIR